jgi:hypothetical protein
VNAVLYWSLGSIWICQNPDFISNLEWWSGLLNKTFRLEILDFKSAMLFEIIIHLNRSCFYRYIFFWKSIFIRKINNMLFSFLEGIR